MENIREIDEQKNIDECDIESPDIDEQLVTLSEPVIRDTSLTSLLDLIKPIDFYRIAKAKNGKISHKVYQVVSISQILKIANEHNFGLATNHGFTYLYTGSFWKPLETDEFKAFLASAAIKLGVPELDALHHQFRGEMYKQFISDGSLPTSQESDTTLINLKNGTFEISDSGQVLRPPRPSDFLKYRLEFEYRADATAPMFEAFLTHVLPEPELQNILAEFLGYVFLFNMKLEKVLVLYGTGANGKSVIFDIIHALLGRENVSAYQLDTLTQAKSYERAELQNRILNYSSEMNGKLDSGIFKALASGESVEARSIYGPPFLLS